MVSEVQFLGAFLFLFYLSFLYFGGIFNKTIIIIPLELVVYRMFIANSALHASLAIYLSYQTRIHGIIIVRYTHLSKILLFQISNSFCYF